MTYLVIWNCCHVSHIRIHTILRTRTRGHDVRQFKSRLLSHLQRFLFSICFAPFNLFISFCASAVDTFTWITFCDPFFLHWKTIHIHPHQYNIFPKFFRCFFLTLHKQCRDIGNDEALKSCLEPRIRCTCTMYNVVQPTFNIEHWCKFDWIQMEVVTCVWCVKTVDE